MSRTRLPLNNARPDDIQPTMFWYETVNTATAWGARAVPNPDAHAEGCDVYWGSHGCHRPRGHEGPHWCDCCNCEDHPDDDSGCVAGPPYYGDDTYFWGDDA